jgi:histidinol-phosphatase (PHP family)
VIDLHTHHQRCGHAAGQLEDYLKAARGKGLKVLGVSDHSPLFAAADDEALPGMHMAKSAFASYLKEASELKARYAGELELLLGVEADYLPGTEPCYAEAFAAAPLDYVLGGVHYFGGYHVYDHRRWRNVTDAGAAYREYFALVRQAARSGLFDVMAHIDAVKGCGVPPGLSLDADLDATVATLQACDVAVEINSSGLRKCGELFPSPRIIARLTEAGVPLTFGSDAHAPSEVHGGWPEVRRLLKQLGVRELAVFRCRRRAFVML